MCEGTKQVRVDNWGVFFLQRLQMFFSKTDYCDLTLQFEGNVQLKVHRLVINACTEYFDFLERSCPSVEENVILMPANLQADVIVPIVNFIYTGMLEFQVSMFDKLYKAADLMSISVLTKLLDAQKGTLKKKPAWLQPVEKRQVPRPPVVAKELPSTMPGRKLPVWKRKVIPHSSHSYADRSQDSPSQSVPDNTPKPTRFEWPDEDLPSLSLMETSVDDISFTSKPLLTQDDELQASTSFDHLKNSASNVVSSTPRPAKKEPNPPDLDIDEIKDFIKEQKIRNELAAFEDEVDNTDSFLENSAKRKLETKQTYSPKKIRISEKENKETTISITSKSVDLDHNKIVADILKKYPHLVKKNKNIRLKIVAAGANNKPQTTEIKVAPNDVKHREQSHAKSVSKGAKAKDGSDLWVCNLCAENGDHVEYQMFYMYKKHMVELHGEHFDDDLCKYCGLKCPKSSIMMYHMFTKHGVKASKGVHYPTCNQCPYIAISHDSLERHNLYHGKSDVQCGDCQLAFSSAKSFTRHVQITGHTNGERGRDLYDCQFCTKKYQSCTNLFQHVKEYHLEEARRDGLVLIDDDDFLDDLPILEDYIVHENSQDKVNIISNVKVGEGPTLEPSSEAEALSNVASGIATSLNLVDIVVLDENQQYILQQTQETQSGNQQGFILPQELGGGQTTYHQQVQQPDGMSATDELVMVLTDHDYQDGQDATNVDNSNIVVLYSHPVDGQQGQYITSQGNLMVNSEMGLLEIRNGNQIATTTASQLLSSDGPIESIEMIQREIESHTSSINKPDVYYEPEAQAQLEPVPTSSAETSIQTAPTKTKTSQAKPLGMPLIDQDPEPEPEPEATPQTESIDTTDAPNVELACEPMEVDEEAPLLKEELKQYEPPAVGQDLPSLQEEDNEGQDEAGPGLVVVQEEGQEEEQLAQNETSDSLKDVDDKEDHEPSPEFEHHGEEPAKTEQDGDNNEDEAHALVRDFIIPEAMEVDGFAKPDEVSLNNSEVTESEQDVQHDELMIEESKEENQNEAQLHLEQELQQSEPQEQDVIEEKPQESLEEDKPELVPEDEVHQQEQNLVEAEEVSQSVDSQLDPSETSNSQFNDDNSQDKAKDVSPSMKASILDDWDDTDSQQSEKNKNPVTAVKANKDAEERVNKLMDDWEEDDEDDGNKKHINAE